MTLQLALTLVVAQTVSAQTYTVLYDFCSVENCADGRFPDAGVIVDTQGNLYGTTAGGGANLRGAVFKVAPDGTETVLHSFHPVPLSLADWITDGESPFAGLVMDARGNLYGTTLEGGSFSRPFCNGICGTVFELSPAGKEKVLHAFAWNYTDGWQPLAGLIMDAQGNLYGTTSLGGEYFGYCPSFGCGVVFKVTPDGTETLLYNFYGPPFDGEYPYAGLIMDAQGSLYGTTQQGGASPNCWKFGCGTVFKVTPEGIETVLYSFCSQALCVDGLNPEAGLTMDAQGNLYGTTSGGGAYASGTVFKRDPSGNLTVLYSFGSYAKDGWNPQAGVIMDAQGNLYGTTFYGGTGASCDLYCGTVFKLSPDGTETVLHDFTGSPDGANPVGNLVMDAQGNLYGTTTVGGAYGPIGGGGTVFKIAP